MLTSTHINPSAVSDTPSKRRHGLIARASHPRSGLGSFLLLRCAIRRAIRGNFCTIAVGNVPVDTFFDTLQNIVGRRLRLGDQALRRTTATSTSGLCVCIRHRSAQCRSAVLLRRFSGMWS